MLSRDLSADLIDFPSFSANCVSFFLFFIFLQQIQWPLCTPPWKDHKTPRKMFLLGDFTKLFGGMSPNWHPFEGVPRKEDTTYVRMYNQGFTPMGRPIGQGVEGCPDTNTWKTNWKLPFSNRGKRGRAC